MLRIFRNKLTKETAASYALGMGTVTAGLALNLILGNWIEPRATTLFLAAVVVTAWLGGKYPSLFATILAVLPIDFFFVPPLYSFELSFENAINAVVFVGVAFLISWIDDERKRAVRERDRLLESEREARCAAEEANRAKDEFLAMVTHELRSPLNAISGWTQMLKKETLDRTQTSRALDVIERNTRTQAQLVEDLLDISRIRVGKFRVSAEPIDLCPVIDDAIESIAASLAAKHIRLLRNLDERTGKINGDAKRLRQIVWNILSNAVKFTPEGGQIEVRLERANNHALLKIYDNGAGISHDFLPLVFDSFRQSDEGGKAKHKGLGLGLAIVRHLVEAQGGTVRAHSEGVGLGATFTVELPLLAETSSAEKPHSGQGTNLEYV